MGELSEAAAGYVRGGFTLFVGNLVSYVFLAVGSIFVARMLSPAEYGLYAVCMVLPQFFLLFSDWGVNTALTRFLSRYRVEGRFSEIWELNWVGFVFKLVVSCLLSLMLVLSADFLSVVVLKRPGIGDLVRVASVFMIFYSLYTTVVAILTGLDRMDLVAVVNISEALVKGIISPILVYFGFGVFGALMGYICSYGVSSILGTLLVLVYLSRSKMRITNFRPSFEGLGLMLSFGWPLFMNGLVAGVANRFQGFLLSWFVSDVDFGNYHVAMNFSSLVSLLTGAIAVTLFPAFSRLSFLTERGKMREAFMSSIRYSSLFVVPAVFLFVAVSEPLVSFLYTARYPDAPLFMSMMLVPNLLVGLGSLSVGNFFNSQGDTRANFRVGLVSSAISILISPVLIWTWGVFGLLLSIVISSLVRSVLGLYVLREKYGMLPDVQYAVRIVVCSSASAALVYGVLRLVQPSIPILSLFVGGFMFLVSCMLLAPLMNVIDEGDILNLGSMVEGIRVVSVFIGPLLEVEKRVILFIRERGEKKTDTH